MQVIAVLDRHSIALQAEIPIRPFKLLPIMPIDTTWSIIAMLL
jgi:hypothetical protein